MFTNSEISFGDTYACSLHTCGIIAHKVIAPLERKVWKKDMRLRRPEDFRRVWSEGRSWAHPLLVLWALPNDVGRARVGVTASRKVGNAVARNRARRLLREAARQLYGNIALGWDLVLLARSPLVEAKESEVETALKRLLHRASLWETTDRVRGL